MKLISINTHNTFTQIRWLPYKCFVHYSFTGKDCGRSTNNISSFFFCSKSLSASVKGWTLNLLIYVSKCWPNCVICIQNLAYQSLCWGELQSFSALPSMFEKCFFFVKPLQKICKTLHILVFPDRLQIHVTLCSHWKHFTHSQPGYCLLFRWTTFKKFFKIDVTIFETFAIAQNAKKVIRRKFFLFTFSSNSNFSENENPFDLLIM